MLLGFASFAELPFSTSGPDNSVTISATKNQLTISIGDPGITADSITENVSGSPLTLGFGTLSITGEVFGIETTDVTPPDNAALLNVLKFSLYS